MATQTARGLAWGFALLGALGSAEPLPAQIGVGTWVRKATESAPGMTMTVEACCGAGRRLSYHLGMSGTTTTLVLESRLDGSDAPVLINGQPSGETMALRRVDDHHLTAVLKLNGKQFATAQATLSADGKTLTVLNEYTSAAAGQPVGKVTEVWVKQ